MRILKLLFVNIIYLSIFCNNVDGGGLSSGDTTTNVTETQPGSNAILLFTTVKSIEKLDLATKTVSTVLQNATNPSSITCDVSKNLVYWSTNEKPNCSFRRCNLNDVGSSQEILIEKGLRSTAVVAFDWITGNLYYVEAEVYGLNGHFHIGFCNTERRFCALLMHNNISRPEGIALHPNKGIFFYSDWDSPPHISRCSMDSSDCQKIVSSNLNHPHSIILDEKMSRIYFLDLYSIESVTLEGTDRRKLLFLSLGLPYGLALLEDQVYWSAYDLITGDRIYSCNKSDGSNVQALTLDQGLPLYKVAIVDVRIQLKIRENSCLAANCSHLCTLKMEKSFRCHCPVGMTLIMDSKTCIKCEETTSCDSSDCKLNCKEALHLHMSYIQTCKTGWKLSSDGSRSCEDINECEKATDCDHYCVNTIGSYHCKCHSKYVLDSEGKLCLAVGLPPLLVYLNNSEIFTTDDDSLVEALKVNTSSITVDSFDVDSNNRNIYWSNTDRGIIGKADLNGNSEVVITGLHHPHSIAFDWVSNNIYFISSPVNESKANPSLMVCYLGRPGLCAKLYELGNVVVSSLQLYPEGNLLFWIEKDLSDSKFRIRKSFLDGSDPEDCFVDKRTINGMTIDIPKNKIFWIINEDVLMEAHLNCSSTNDLGTLEIDLEDGGSKNLDLKDPSVFPMQFDVINYESWIAFHYKEKLYYCPKEQPAPCFSNRGLKYVTRYNFLQASLQPQGNDSCVGNPCNNELCLPSKNAVSKYKCISVISQMKNQRVLSDAAAKESSTSSAVTIVISIICIIVVVAVASVLYYRRGIQLSSFLPTRFQDRFRFSYSRSREIRKPAESIYGECSNDPLDYELYAHDIDKTVIKTFTSHYLSI